MTRRNAATHLSFLSFTALLVSLGAGCGGGVSATEAGVDALVSDSASADAPVDAAAPADASPEAATPDAVSPTDVVSPVDAVSPADAAPSDVQSLDAAQDAPAADVAPDAVRPPVDAGRDAVSDVQTPPDGGCVTNRDCDTGLFCQLPSGAACGTVGACAPRPTLCPGFCLLQCGCDNVSYCNPCMANRAGTNIAHAGSCGGGL